MSYFSLLIAILRFRESESNDLEANEDTNYDLTDADLHVVKREIYEEECDPNLKHTSIRLLTN